MSAPRPAPLLPLRQDTAAVAAWRGGARTHPDGGGARGTSRSWTFLCWGGGQAPSWGASPPPSYVPADGGGDEAAGTRPAPAAAHCRAVQRGSVHLFSRVALPAHRDEAAAAARAHGRIAAILFFMRRHPRRLVSVRASAFVCITVHFIQDPPRHRGRQPGDYLGDPV